MFRNTTDFTKLFEESRRLNKIQKEQKLEKQLKDTADEAITQFRKRLYSDIDKNSVQNSYSIAELVLDYMNIDNTTCSEFKTIIKNKLIGLGFNRFELFERKYVGYRNNDVCSVDISTEKKSE